MIHIFRILSLAAKTKAATKVYTEKGGVVTLLSF